MNTDIDGSLIVVLSETEARLVYEYLGDKARSTKLTDIECQLARKLAYNLSLPDFSPQT